MIDLTSLTAWPVIAAISISVAPALANRETEVPRRSWNVRKRDPHGGHLFVFRGRRGDLIKCLWSEGQGLCLFAKRLERGRFLWPSTADGTVTISMAQLGYLLDHAC
jgi:hypothetical protein